MIFFHILEDCRDTEKGMEYRGKINVTKDGTPCQHWDSTYPHLPNERVRSLGSTLFKEKNYCRNPDDEPFPWCYTMDINIRWQFCDIPFCVNCKYFYSQPFYYSLLKFLTHNDIKGLF